MDVRTGYKKTEVGVIPEEWDVKPLRECIVAARLGGNYANRDTATDWPLMKMGNLGRGRFDLGKIQYVIEGAAPAVEHRLSRGDVLFNTRNTLELVGKVAIWRDELPIAYFNSNLLRLDFDPGVICSNDYASIHLNTQACVSRLRALATGTTSVAAIYTRDLLGLPIVVPTPDEQCSIAAVVEDIEALLASLDRLIAKKRDLKQAAMQQLLRCERRLPGFVDAWEPRHLGDLGVFIKGSGVRKDQTQSGELPCIRYGEIYTLHHDVVRSYSSFISREVARTATRLKIGDLLFAGSGETKAEIGKCVAFADDCEAYAGGDIVIFRSSTIDPVFMGYYCNTAAITSQKASKGQGDAVVHISASALASIEVRLPGLAEQSAIAAVLLDIDAELAALEARRAKTQALKQGMMQALLTGQIRLQPSSDPAAGESAA